MTVNAAAPAIQQSYTGIVGTDLNIRAAFSTNMCELGDLVLLHVVVEGHADMQSVVPPQLAIQPQLRALFAVEEGAAVPRAAHHAVTFTYSVRPTCAGTFEFPRVTLTYFDTRSDNYQSLRTSPLPLRVVPPSPELRDRTAETGVRMVAALRPGTVKDTQIRLSPSVGQIWIAMTPLGIWLLAEALYRLHRRRTPLRKSRSARRATLVALQVIRRDAVHMTSESRKAACTRIAAELRTSASTFFGIKAATLTPRDAAAALRSAGTSGKTAEDWAALLDRITDLQYRQARVNQQVIEDLCSQAEDVVRVMYRERQST